MKSIYFIYGTKIFNIILFWEATSTTTTMRVRELCYLFDLINIYLSSSQFGGIIIVITCKFNFEYRGSDTELL